MICKRITNHTEIKLPEDVCGPCVFFAQKANLPKVELKVVECITIACNIKTTQEIFSNTSEIYLQ